MHRVRRNRAARRSECKDRIGGSEKRSRKNLKSVSELDRTLVEVSMSLFNLPSREKLVVRKHLRMLHRGLFRGGSVSGAIPRYFLSRNAA